MDNISLLPVKKLTIDHIECPNNIMDCVPKFNNLIELSIDFGGMFTIMQILEDFPNLEVLKYWQALKYKCCPHCGPLVFDYPDFIFFDDNKIKHVEIYNYAKDSTFVFKLTDSEICDTIESDSSLVSKKQKNCVIKYPKDHFINFNLPDTPRHKRNNLETRQLVNFIKESTSLTIQLDGPLSSLSFDLAG